jgi:hypothetical protein
VAMSGSMDASTLKGSTRMIAFCEIRSTIVLGSESQQAHQLVVYKHSSCRSWFGTIPIAGHGQYFSGEISSAFGIGPMMQMSGGILECLHRGCG